MRDIRGPVVADSADEGGHVEQWQAIDAEPLPQTGISHWFDGVTVEEFGTVDGVVGQSMGELDEHEELADTGTREQALLVAGSGTAPVSMSTIWTDHSAGPGGRAPRASSARSHPQGTVHANRLAVEVVVVDDGERELGELRRAGKPLREGNSCCEGSPELVGNGCQHGRFDDAGCDADDADAVLRRSRAAGRVSPTMPPLRRGVGGLPDLSVEGRDARGVDDDAALAVGVRVGLGDRFTGDGQDGERADQVDLDHLAIQGEVVDTFAPDDPGAGCNAGTVDDGAQRMAGSAVARSTAARTWASSVTSAATWVTPSTAAAFSMLPGRSRAMTVAPCPAKAAAVAAPRPERRHR